MKTALIAIILTFASLTAHSEPTSLVTSLPAAPTPATVKQPHVFTAVDWSLSAALMASHVADFTSTESCISRPTCTEKILPLALIHNRPGFLAYELATAGLETYAQYRLERMGHRRIARVIQAVNIGATFRTDAQNVHNTQLATSLR